MRSIIAASLLALVSGPALAMDWSTIRLGPQVSVGTSGFEFGAFAEFDIFGGDYRLRPELFVHDGDRPAAGLAFLWHATFVDLPAAHSLHMGPRVAYHNGKHRDDPRGEISYMGVYNLPIPPMQADTKHHLEIYAALGVVDEDGAEVAATVGAGYCYRF